MLPCALRDNLKYWASRWRRGWHLSSLETALSIKPAGGRAIATKRSSLPRAYGQIIRKIRTTEKNVLNLFLFATAVFA